MTSASNGKVRCAIYTRVSTDQGLDQDFNSLDAQHEAASAYIKSQAHAGWTLIRARYDDGGYSGGSTDRLNLQRLLDDVRVHKIDVIVVYKVDRLTRSLADFAKLVELFDAHNVSFVSVTQQFNTTTSMGRLTLNVLLSFAQFEREVTSERIHQFAKTRSSAGGLQSLRAEACQSCSGTRRGHRCRTSQKVHAKRLMELGSRDRASRDPTPIGTGNSKISAPGLFQLIAADDVAAIVADVELAAPRKGRLGQRYWTSICGDHC